MRQLSKSGFPIEIRSVSDVVAIATDVGQKLKSKQAAVVAVYKGQESGSADVWVKSKPDGSSLTSSDIWAQKKLLDKLGRLPQNRAITGIISEEAEERQNAAQVGKPLLWMIDPLDNTGDYKRGRDNWSVTIGFLRGGKPMGGVVYYPAQERLYYTGDDGHSYFVQGIQPPVRLQCPALRSVSTANVITDEGVSSSFSRLASHNMHGGHTERYWAILLSQTSAQKAGVMGGAHIAEHGNLFYAWDIAGPAAIAARAGAVYAKRNGLPLNFLQSDQGHHPFELPREGFIAGNRRLLKAVALG